MHQPRTVGLGEGGWPRREGEGVNRIPSLEQALAYQKGGEQRLIDDTPQEERQLSRAPDPWTTKDLIGHVTAWRADLMDLIEGRGPGRPQDNESELDQENERIFAELRGRTWEEVYADWQAALSQALEWLRSSGEDGLENDEESWQYGRPLWRHFVGTIIVHPHMHLLEHWHEAGAAEQAERAEVKMSDLLLQIDSSPDWTGVVNYNRACYRVQVGPPEVAFTLLAKAFEAAPRLQALAREDPDLESLRDLEDFQALIAG